MLLDSDFCLNYFLAFESQILKRWLLKFKFNKFFKRFSK